MTQDKRSKRVNLKRVSVIVLVNIFLFTACEKDQLREAEFLNPPLESYLSRYFWIKSNSGNLDTLMSVLFYDNQKRVISVHDSLVLNGVNSFFAKTDYYYQGADSFPYKSQLLVEDGQFRDSTTRFFFYDNSGRRSKDSTIERYTHDLSEFDKYLIVVEYQYSTGRIYGSSMRTNLNTQITTSSLDTAFLNSQNNIIESVNYNGSNSRVKFTFTYDTNPTPFANTNIKVTRDVFPEGSTYHDLMMFNNQTYIKEENFQTGTSRESFLGYSYDSVGRPLHFIVPNSSDPTRFLKMHFIYSTW